MKNGPPRATTLLLPLSLSLCQPRFIVINFIIDSSSEEEQLKRGRLTENEAKRRETRALAVVEPPNLDNLHF